MVSSRTDVIRFLDVLPMLIAKEQIDQLLLLFFVLVHIWFQLHILDTFF